MNAYFVETRINLTKKKLEHKLSQVTTYEFEKNILDAAIEGQDDWAENVCLRLSYIHASISDLIAAEAQQHKQCRSNFNTRRSTPIPFRPIEHIQLAKKVKHNPEDLCKRAFDESIQFFRFLDDDEMFTVKNVSEKMRELLTDENTEVYSNPTIRVKLESMSHDIYIYTRGTDNHRPLTISSETLLVRF